MALPNTTKSMQHGTMESSSAIRWARCWPALGQRGHSRLRTGSVIYLAVFVVVDVELTWGHNRRRHHLVT